jgi:FkbM family methyltransferase
VNNLRGLPTRLRWLRERRPDYLAAFASRVRPSAGVRLLWLRDRRRDLSLRLVEAVVRQGDIVLDVGANWGYFTYRLASLVGPHGHVHAFEPDPVVRRRLDAIGRVSGNVSVYPVGLSDRDGEARLNVPLVGDHRVSGMASVAVPQARATVPHEEVPIRLERLDALPLAGGPVAFIKCDVEGHELAVLRGGETMLRRSLPTLLVEIEQRHQDTDIHETFDFLTGLGYAGYAIHDSRLWPLADFDVQRDQLSLLTTDRMQAKMAPAYVSNFLFCASSMDVAAWIDD